MEAQQYIAVFILIYGVAYALLLFRAAWKDKEAVRGEKGKFWQMSLGETVVYFLTTMGFPDFILNTLLFQRMSWVEDKRLPGTLVAGAVFPSAVISFSYLRNGETLGLATLLLCMAAIVAGSLTGARVMTALSGKAIRRIMGVAILFSMGALVLKMAVSAGAVGTASALTPWQLCVALPIIFFFGFINMFGVPMKPPAIALFLLLGMSPMSTLALMLAMGVASPMAGGIRVMRSGIYQKKAVLAASTFGVLGALAGAAFTVSLNATALSVILLIIMAITAVSMLRPARDGDAAAHEE